MGVTGGPDPIVDNGLVFTIDPANKRSYVSGSSTAFDMIGNNDGTLSNVSFRAENTVTWEMVRSSNSQIDLGNSNTLSPLSGDVSWCFWVNKHSATNTQCVLGNWSSNSTQYYLWLGYETNDDQISVYFEDSKRMTLSCPQSQWHYVVITFQEGASNPALIGYVNGVQADTDSHNTWEGAHLNLSLGRDLNRNNYGTDAYYGPMHIYNRALSAAEVLQNYNAIKHRFV